MRRSKEPIASLSSDSEYEADGYEEDEEQRLHLQLVREVRFLRAQLADSEEANALVQSRLATLTAALDQTTEEIERRVGLFSDTAARVEQLEQQVADAKKTLLTKEMQLHGLTQESGTMRKVLDGKESERSYWEQEFIRTSEQLSDATRRNVSLQTENNELRQEIRTWKAKLKRALRMVDRLKQRLDEHGTKEAELMQTALSAKRSEIQSEQLWQAKTDKLQHRVHELEEELHVLHEYLSRGKQEEQETEVARKADVAADHMEKQRQIVELRDKLSKLMSSLEKAQLSERLLHRETRRLREELLLSEAQRETEQRRVEQVVRGKDKEVAFIWKNTVVDMEDLGFFNEREAECFEREDTLSLSDLEKLNVSEDLPEMERAEQLLKTGLDKQKISVLASLPKLLSSNNSKTNLVAWQKCEADLSNSGAVLLEIFRGISSLACATVDGKVLSVPTVSFHDEYMEQLAANREEKKDAVFLLSDEQVAKLLVPLALDIVAEIQSKDYAEAASVAVIALLSRLGGGLKKTQILRVAIDKGDVSQPPGSRLICCLLLGAVTAQGLLSPQDIEGLFFQKMMALCQDTDAEVRRCMCIQVDALARAVGEEKACSDLLPELLELLQDEEEQVKQAAFLALLSLLDFFSPAERIKRVIPEFLNLIEADPDYLMLSIAEQYGSIVTKLATLNHLGGDTAPAFLQSYAKLCAKEDAQIRQFCAYNFPAIVKAFGGTYVPLLMDDLLVKLCNDPVEKVRYHVAAGIHEIVLLLGQQRAQRYLKPLCITLLRDEAPLVQGMAIARVPQIMSSMFAASDEDAKASVLDAVIKAIIQFHSVLPASRNREQLAFVETLQSFPSFCSSMQMYEMVIPILFDLVEDGARPVQLLAVHVLVKCIRKNDVASHRYSLLSKLRNEFGHAKSYWRRLLYLDACVFALAVNSRQYCRLNFLDLAIDLLEDPVPNVRFKAATVVPQWRDVLTHLSDDKMLERLRLFLEDAAVDVDRDVANAVLEAKAAIETSEIGRPQRRPQDDADDKRRVSEEENLGLVADHEDSSADSKWSSMLEYTLVVGKDGQVVRRARVKSLDLVNKLTRTQGKDTGRGAGGPGGTGMMGSLGLGSIGSGALTVGMAVRPDPNRGKSAPKTPNKPSPPLTTLPNCAPARPANAKTPQAIKVMGSVGKLTAATPTGKATATATRSGTGLPKDAGAVTKIPIIRPSAPAAKRENSPSTGTKPGSSGAVGSGSLGAMAASSVVMASSIASAGGGAVIKSRLGTIDSPSSSGSSSSTSVKPKATAPTATRR
ncbi:hypothetical protein PybrP1_012716 [[Pythium] brassicae (nom. inval.)]|nr:hypothetical protein PybrP1_012716 [[Pythium] brassicae (nom. inval.)]